jgi:hypothetical protein
MRVAQIADVRVFVGSIAHRRLRFFEKIVQHTSGGTPPHFMKTAIP